MIAGFAEELAAIPVLMVVENGCGQPMYLLILDKESQSLPTLYKMLTL
jgi:hypothetical protein